MAGKGHGRVLIVDDEPNAIRVLSAILTAEGYDIVNAKDVDGAISLLKREDVDAVISDMKMPGKDGAQFYDYLSEHYPDIPLIFLTAYGTVDSAVHAITKGAFYYFIKPPDYPKLKGILARAVEQRSLKREIEGLRKQLTLENNADRIIGATPQIHKILETIHAVKNSASSVLICGETGTGKELIARMLHFRSCRKDRPFVAVNCAAMPRDLIESELFGYEKGAFTGALSRRIGRFEEVGDGTLFLDEIGELDMSLQAKLLRVLQEKEIERIGSNRKIDVNFRLVCSTNRQLQNEIQAGNFRDDLFYRINVVMIQVPPLRERQDDIPLLTAEFVKEYCAVEKKLLTVSDEVMEMFVAYPWPGNIRQLRNIVERAVVLARGKKITARELPDEFLATCKPVSSSTFGSVVSLRDLQSKAVSDALEKCHGNKSLAARMLGISRKALYKRLSE